MKKKLRSAFNTRQYMLSEDFEIYYYSDLHLQSIDSHRHDYFEFYFFVEGAVEMEINDVRYPLTLGDVIVVPPGIPHRAVILDSDIPYRRFVFWISKKYCEGLRRESADYTILFQHLYTSQQYIYPFAVIEFNTIRSKLLTILDEIHADRFGRDTRIYLSIRDLLFYLNRSVYEQQHSRFQTDNLSSYEIITQYIDLHLDEELTLDKLERELFLSKYYIAHLFQENIGLSVHQYISKKRLAACAASIRSGMSISEAYPMCGFKDYSGFYRAFRKEYGMSPSEYKSFHEQAPT